METLLEQPTLASPPDLVDQVSRELAGNLHPIIYQIMLEEAQKNPDAATPTGRSGEMVGSKPEGSAIIAMDKEMFGTSWHRPGYVKKSLEKILQLQNISVL